MKIKKYLKRNLIYINFLVAFIALIIATPDSINNLFQLVSGLTEVKKTEVLKFSPPDVDLNKAKTGDCWTNSIASNRSDAFRCSNENEILDPCFLTENFDAISNQYVYCPDGPKVSSKDLILSVNLSGLLTGEKAPTGTTPAELEKTNPWLVLFEDGSKCRILTGTVENAYANLTNIYGCTGSIVAVTESRRDGDKFYFDCKSAKESYFKKCLAKEVVY